MSFFSIVIYTMLILVLGYMIGHRTGLEEGYIQGTSDMYKANR